MTKIRYILFDVAGTLLHKPLVYSKIHEILQRYDYEISLKEIQKRHKLLSESFTFPDQTSPDFYTRFNTELLYNLGIIPTEVLVRKIYQSCSNLSWEAFGDTKFLSHIDLPIGVLSNFNTGLKQLLHTHFGSIFNCILDSESVGLAKPDWRFFEKALKQIQIPANEILYVGDSLKLDIVPAKQLGLQYRLIDRDAIYIDTTYHISCLEELKSVIPNF